MKRSDLCSAMRRHVKDHLSPTESDRKFVSDVYASVCDALGQKSCIQIGSYPRFTAVRPLHDLDCLFVAGSYEGNDPDPETALRDVRKKINANFKNPTRYSLEIGTQSHSVTMRFLSGTEEKFSVDIVPAFEVGLNEFGDSVYWVPEIANRNPSSRREAYESAARLHKAIGWIKSDPRGYISVAAETNKRNGDFRRSVKFAKGWRAAAKQKNPGFPLKAFHLEQVITGYFRSSPELEIFDAVFRFFCDIPNLLSKPQIPDRANTSKYIDEYVRTLSHAEKEAIIEARDYFLIELEKVRPDGSLGSLFTGDRRKRACSSESYLFDQAIPVLVDEPLRIVATATKTNGFREQPLDQRGAVSYNRKIRFRLAEPSPTADVFKWKVKNDDACGQPRGEISDHSTRNDPETAKLKGSHYVECYAIRHNICIAKARQNIVLEREWI